MHYYFLPAFYLCLTFSILIYWFWENWLDITKFEFRTYLNFLQEFRYEVLLFIIPLSFMFFKLLWLIISAFWWYLIKKVWEQDQLISKDTYEKIWKNKVVLTYLNQFYKFEDNIEQKDLVTWPVYWHIFHYVMDYYYGQENVYDDLRRAIFIRNIIASNIILIGLLFFIWLYIWENIMTLIYVIFLVFFTFFLLKMYSIWIVKYHLKLVLTFIYIYTNINNISNPRNDIRDTK